MKPTYIHSLTPMRGIAALLVVIFHMDVIIYYQKLGSFLQREQSGLIFSGYLWVDFFFLLSGFIMAHVYGESLSSTNKVTAIKAYLWARFSRLYPLHIFTILLLIGYSQFTLHFFPSLTGDFWHTVFSWSALPSNLLFTNAMNQYVFLSWNIVAWSIGAEWWTYVAAIPLLMFASRRNLPSILVMMLLAFVGLAYLMFSLPDRILDITYNYGFVRCFFEFVIGLGVYELYRRRLAEKLLARDISFGVLAMATALIFHFRLNDLFIIPVFSAMILAVSFNQTRLSQFLNLPLMRYLGDRSFSIYLMHGVWFSVFWALMPMIKAALDGGTMNFGFKLLYAVSFLALTLLSAHWSYRFVEVGAREYLRSRFSFSRP